MREAGVLVGREAQGSGSGFWWLDREWQETEAEGWHISLVQYSAVTAEAYIQRMKSMIMQQKIYILLLDYSEIHKQQTLKQINTTL